MKSEELQALNAFCKIIHEDHDDSFIVRREPEGIHLRDAIYTLLNQVQLLRQALLFYDHFGDNAASRKRAKAALEATDS